MDFEKQFRFALNRPDDVKEKLKNIQKIQLAIFVEPKDDEAGTKRPKDYEIAAANLIASALSFLPGHVINQKHWEDIVSDGFSMVREIIDTKNPSYEPFYTNLMTKVLAREEELIARGVVTSEEVASWHEMGW